MSGTNFVFFTKSDLLFHAALPKSSVVDSDDETLHVPKRKRLRVLEDDLVCSEYVHSETPTSMTTPACKTASACETASSSAYQADNESEDSKDFVLVGIPKSIKKTKEESTPLPDPFPLPTNYRPDIHLCLAKKKMTKTARAAIYTAVAAAMFQYKRYPSRDDFISVARQIIAKYPFLGSTSFGASHVSKIVFAHIFFRVSILIVFVSINSDINVHVVLHVIASVYEHETTIIIGWIHVYILFTPYWLDF